MRLTDIEDKLVRPLSMFIDSHIDFFSRQNFFSAFFSAVLKFLYLATILVLVPNLFLLLIGFDFKTSWSLILFWYMLATVIFSVFLNDFTYKFFSQRLTKIDEAFKHKIQKHKEKRNAEYINSIDLSALCVEMLKAAEKKYRYTNRFEKLDSYQDFIEFQRQNNRFRTDVVPGAYGVAYDNVVVASNEFWEWLFNRNYLAVNVFQRGCAIELNWVAPLSAQGDDQGCVVKLKVTTKSMEERGQGEWTCADYFLNSKGEVSYESVSAGRLDFFDGFVEKDMNDFLKLETIKFMRNFIDETERLIS